MARAEPWEPAEGYEPGTAVEVAPARSGGAVVSASETIGLAPEAWTLASRIANTDFVPSALRGKPEAVLACFLTGNELGLPLMTSLTKVHIIDSRPALASETMRALVLRAGHDVWVEEKSTTMVTVGGRRAGSTRDSKVTWTMDDAKRAGLDQRQNWKKYPRAMLTARAMAELCRDVFPDVIGGLYSAEELEDGFIWDEGPGGPEAPAPAPGKKVSSPAARKRLSQKAKAAAAEGPEPEPPTLPDDDIEDAVIVDDEPAEAPPLPEDLDVDEPPAEGQPAEPARTKPSEDQVRRTKQMQRIAMTADELGVDRAHVISAVTVGAKTSARDLDETERDQVIEALRRMKVGEIRLEDGEDGWELVDAPQIPNQDPGSDDDVVVDGELVDDDVVEAVEGDPGDGEAWRAHIRGAGVTLSSTLKFARGVALENELVAPGDVHTLAQSHSVIRRAVLEWIEAGGDG